MRKIIYIVFALIVLNACRDEKEIVTPSTEQVTSTAQNIGGFYLLNEGNMGSNKSTLDYFDYETGVYMRNIYAQANPTMVQELGDVGTDVEIYGSKLYAVINCSNLIEVMDAHTSQHRGTINIPNCRYVRFQGEYGYATSYAGPVTISPTYEQRGYVAKFDTATLQIVDTCIVGFQPDELEIVNQKIYVANSGGYMSPNFDNTISVIDIDTFQEIKRITVAPNLFRLKTDNYNQLWVSSRGNYKNVASKLYCIDLTTETLSDSIDIPVGGFDILGDSLFVYGNNSISTENYSYTIVDTKTHQIITDNFITDGTDAEIKVPYCLKINSQSNEIFISDAKDYVSPGRLYCFDTKGEVKWSVVTGDIPSDIAFVGKNLLAQNDANTTSDYSRYINKVYEYSPAPGQFVNLLPQYTAGDDAQSMIQKCTDAIANNAGGTITLGAYGGYITFGFDHSIVNVATEADFIIKSNAFSGNSEAGIVMVSKDENQNGLPDDIWFELAGSADTDFSDKIIYGYSITYSPNPLSDISWTDNQENIGTIERNDFHQQEYYPLWLDNELTFSGTLLPSNLTKVESTYTLNSFSWGYADNLPNNNITGNSFDIDNAVDPLTRQSVYLDKVDFIRVYTALNQKAPSIGETSTEICGAEDLHFSN